MRNLISSAPILLAAARLVAKYPGTGLGALARGAAFVGFITAVASFCPTT